MSLQHLSKGLEPFHSVAVFGLGFTAQQHPAFAATFSALGCRWRPSSSSLELAEYLSESPYSLVFVSLSAWQNLSDTEALANHHQSALFVVCGEAFVVELETSHCVADYLCLNISEQQLLSRSRVYVELLQRRILLRQEQQCAKRLQDEREALFSMLPDGVLKISHEGYVVDMNDAALDVLGYSRETLIGAHLSRLLCPPTSEEPLLDWCEHSLYSAIMTQQEKYVTDVPMWRADSLEIPVSGEIACVRSLDPQDKMDFMLVFQDISIRKAEEAELDQLTRYDPITGLGNMSLLRHYLLKGMARALRHDRQIALLYLDLDDFYGIRESMGNGVANQLLRSVGRRLKDCIRAGDMVSRIQNDAFLVVLDEVRSTEDVEKLARQMLRKLNQPFDLEGVPMVAHGSMGIALYPDGSIGIDGLIDNSKAAMEWVKDNGKNGVSVFGKERPLPSLSSDQSIMH